MRRKDDFDERRKHLSSLSEEELEIRFWELASKLVDPLIELAKKILPLQLKGPFF